MANQIQKVIGMVVNRFGKRGKFMKGVEREADQIFMKNYTDRYKDFPAINATNMNTKYAKDYQGVYNQVLETRKNKKYSNK